ncbi:MAG: SDR family NAD(P)-dependent oxidoreductase [Campylobacterales bacterium]|nr:SDR family NAD(P)-dependent oxidoreductase [Campylobacterales bacterium]
MKSILITGCSTGIGLETAHFLKQQNYQVFPTARKEEDVKKLKDLGFDSFLLDLKDEESMDSSLKNILKITGGTLDALFNNGAYGQPGAVEDLTTEVLKEQFETNFFGWHTLTRKVLKIMRKQGHGKIIQNSSVLGIISLKFRGAYNSSKYALEGLTDTLRLELENSNIHISLIEPGPIKSNFRQNAMYKFKKNIKIQGSPFEEIYQKVLARLERKKSDDPFTLPPTAVGKKVLKILETKNPKPRYYVTTPTYIFGFLKRVLSSPALDKILMKVSNEEN